MCVIQIREIRENDLKHLKRLKWLVLDRNHLQTIKNNVMKVQYSLEHFGNLIDLSFIYDLIVDVCDLTPEEHFTYYNEHEL